jgi:hypothetical protein
MKILGNDTIVREENYTPDMLITDQSLADKVRGTIGEMQQRIVSPDRVFKSCNAVIQLVDYYDRTHTYLIQTDDNNLSVKYDSGQGDDRALKQPDKVFEDFFQDILTEEDLKGAVTTTSIVCLPNRTTDINNAKLKTVK